MDLRLHKTMLAKVLLTLYKNTYLSQVLGFKGWTCAMFFYDLPRLSVDLDFDILRLYDDVLEQGIIREIEPILRQFWEITDFAVKKNTILYEIRYQNYERRLKLEISTRGASGRFLKKNFLWENISVMCESDLFSNKLVALLGRKWITNRDIFDIWFFLAKWIQIHEWIIMEYTQKDLVSYLDEVKDFIKDYDFKKVLYGLWELLDAKQKNFAKTKMQDEILWYLNFYP